ncbi:MAG: hypothetical protein ABI340_01475 [Nitrososphaera sp.]|jgi:hypothetical protein
MSDNPHLDNDDMSSIEIDALDLLKGKMSEKAIRIMNNKTSSK